LCVRKPDHKNKPVNIVGYISFLPKTYTRIFYHEGMIRLQYSSQVRYRDN